MTTARILRFRARALCSQRRRPGSVRRRNARGTWRAAVLGLALAASGCSSTLRVQGSEPRTTLPALEAVEVRPAEYRVWVVVPWLRVNTYPQLDKTQQPMLQFTGDAEQLARGWGEMAMMAAPDQYRDGDEVTFFENKVLWEDRLRLDDPRTFTLWLRENNRSAPTRFDQKLQDVDRVAEAVEAISGLSGYAIPARRAVNVSMQAVKELQRDWLILTWRCPWRHIVTQAAERLEASGQDTAILQAALRSQEEVKGKPAAELKVAVVVRRLQRPLPGGVVER